MKLFIIGMCLGLMSVSMAAETVTDCLAMSENREKNLKETNASIKKLRQSVRSE